MEPQPAEALPEEAGGVAEEASSPSPSPSSQQGPSSTKCACRNLTLETALIELSCSHQRVSVRLAYAVFLGGLSWQTTDGA